MLKCWKLKSWNVEMQWILYEKCQIFNFSTSATFNISTFQHSQLFNFQLFNFSTCSTCQHFKVEGSKSFSRSDGITNIHGNGHRSFFHCRILTAACQDKTNIMEVQRVKSRKKQKGEKAEKIKRREGKHGTNEEEMVIWSYDHRKRMSSWSYEHMIMCAYAHVIIWWQDQMLILFMLVYLDVDLNRRYATLTLNGATFSKCQHESELATIALISTIARNMFINWRHHSTVDGTIRNTSTPETNKLRQNFLFVQSTMPILYRTIPSCTVPHVRIPVHVPVTIRAPSLYRKQTYKPRVIKHMINEWMRLITST